MEPQRGHPPFKQLSVTLLGFLGLVLAMTPIALAQTQVITVCADGGDFATIQAAIEAASAGDVIHVCAATYFETLRIDKDLTLRGESQTATILDGGHTLTTVVSIQPGTTVRITEMTLAQGHISIEKNIDLASPNSLVELITGPYTDTFTVATKLDPQGDDQVTTTITGDIVGNVVIIQANTTVNVENVTMACGDQSLARTFLSDILVVDSAEGEFVFDLDTGHISIQPLEVLCNIETLLDEALEAWTPASPAAPLKVDPNLTLQGGDQVTTTITGDISGNAVIIQANTKVYVDNLAQSSPLGEATEFAFARYEAPLEINSNRSLPGGDQMITIVNGDIIGNLVILQANTTVDVTNVTTFSSIDNEMIDENRGRYIFLPAINK